MLFNIVIVFLLLFTAIMAITINQSLAYSVKDEIITIIEENKGVDISKGIRYNPVIEEIVETTTDMGYRATGTCPSTDYQGFDRNGDLNDREPYICIKQTVGSEIEGSKSCYFSVILFYKLDVPIFREVFNFEVKGETKLLYGSCFNR